MGENDRHRGDQNTEDAQMVASPEPKRSLQRRLVIGLISLVALALLVMLTGAIVPRWWATRIGNIVDKRLTVGSFVGIAVGGLFTLVPLLILWIGWRVRKTFRRWLIVLALAIIVAFPNLATLGIWTGTGSGADIARRDLGTEAPGFLGGTLFGVILGAVTALVLMYLSFSRRRNKQLARDLKAQIRAHGPIDDER
ncbi:MAG: hypothetical protein R2733_22100 [Acidimicrobiales bacterium]